MKIKQVKYYVFILYLILAVALFFSSRIVAGWLYERIGNSGGDNPIADKIFFSLKFYGVFGLLLIAIALNGIFWSRKKKNYDVYKGFVYSLVFSILFSVVYLAVVLYILN